MRGPIRITGWSYTSFRAVVVFLTTNRVEVDLENAVETVALADLYGLPRLRAACFLMIRSRMDVDNVIPLLLQADQVGRYCARDCAWWGSGGGGGGEWGGQGQRPATRCSSCGAACCASHLQLQAEDVKAYCLSFIKSNSVLVANHESFDALETCVDGRLATQVARIIAGGDKGALGHGRSQQKRKRT
jgi:hypothetical protein